MEEKIEVVITIPKYYLECPQDYSYLAECVKGGTPLPKGHGRLIDADAFIDNYEECGWIDDIKVNEFNAITPTILEADKESN